MLRYEELGETGKLEGEGVYRDILGSKVKKNRKIPETAAITERFGLGKWTEVSEGGGRIGCDGGQ